MSQNSVLFFLMAIVGVGLAAGGLFVKRSVAFGLISIVVALLAGLGAWYSWAESAAMPWAIGYSIVAALTGISAVRHFTSRAE